MPGTLVAPEILAARTDASIFRNAGLCVYGFSPFVLNREELARIHGNDERISLDNIHSGVRCYIEMLELMAHFRD